VSVRPGPTNSVVDVRGIRVGHYQRVGDGWLTGTTVVVAPEDGAVGGVDVRGGGPGTRETDLLDPANMVERAHAVSLSGGSAFGLAAADGVVRALYAGGTGFPCGEPGEVVPIVPGAVIFDCNRGGAFDRWPDAGFGAAAVAAASTDPPQLGVVGAGTGAQVGGLKGGVGSASAVLEDGTTVAALVVLNAVGSAVDPSTGDLYGARWLLDGDTDVGAGAPAHRLRTPDPAELRAARQAALDEPNVGLGLPRTLATTIGVIATDATLTKAQAQRMSTAGHDGLARAVDPIHTMVDGDTLFTLATCERPAPDPEAFHAMLGTAAHCVTRAILRAVLAAETVTTPAGRWRSYRDAFPSALTPPS
jgi:L-aminopeptidase/D-esterase-like protein